MNKPKIDIKTSDIPTENQYEDLALKDYDLEQCRCCEKQFVVDPLHPRKHCFVCWKKEKNYKLTASDKNLVWLQQAIDDEKTAVKLNKGGISQTARQLLKSEEKLAKQGKTILEMKNKIKQLEQDKKELKNEIGGYMLGTRIIVGGKWSFSSKRIKTILRFVHPDKVEQKDKAVVKGITTWLLEYLDHVKALENKVSKQGKRAKSKYPSWHSKYETDINK